MTQRSEPRPLVIAMGGLPGSGKTTLARELARRLGALHWDKDALRALLFPAGTVAYTRALNDLCMELFYAALPRALALCTGRPAAVVLDGRPFVEQLQRARMERAVREAGAGLVFVVCRAPLAVLRERVRTGDHPAPDRDAALIDRLARAEAPWPEDAITVDTVQHTPVEAAAVCERALRERGLV